jgi:hypothetical protein
MKITVKLAINHHQPDLQAEMGYGHWIYLSKGAMVPAGCFFGTKNWMTSARNMVNFSEGDTRPGKLTVGHGI